VTGAATGKAAGLAVSDWSLETELVELAEFVELVELAEVAIVLLIDSGESFFCTELLDTVALVPASAAANGLAAVDNLASREESSAGAEALIVVELVAGPDVEPDAALAVALTVVVSDTNAFVVLTSLTESVALPVLLLLVAEALIVVEPGAVLTDVVSDTNAFVVLTVVESDTNAFVVLTSLAETVELPVLLLLALGEAAAAETGARLTVVVTKSADVNFAIVVFATTAKNSPETLCITALVFAVFVPLPWLITRSLKVSAPDKPKTSAPSVKSSTVSACATTVPPSPLDKTKVSLPNPPVSLSAPRPPIKTSSPSPPLRVSTPLPPTKVSVFEEPVSVTAVELLALLTSQPLEPVAAARFTLNPAV